MIRSVATFAAATRAAAGLCLLLGAMLARSSGAIAMSMTVDHSRVVLSGAVEGDECGRLRSILQQSAIRTVVLTQSPGGNADAGYCVGELIRARGLDTVIRGSCNSSCSRMWLGGVSRTLDGNNARVGLHGNYDQNGRLKPGTPERLQTWIPQYAPGVNRTPMEQWTRLPTGRDMMYFYNDRAELCENGQCAVLPEWNAVKAGLATQ
jgi:hypothetical protein